VGRNVKRPATFALLMVALSACSSGFSGEHRSQTEATQVEILSLQKQWAEARIAQDAVFLERFYTSDFRFLAMDGNVVNRDDDIANFATKILKPEMIVDEDMDVRVYGRAAVVTGVERVRGTYRGNFGAFTLRFTNVYVRTRGEWRLAHHHSTPIAGAEQLP